MRFWTDGWCRGTAVTRTVAMRWMCCFPNNRCYAVDVLLLWQPLLCSGCASFITIVAMRWMRCFHDNRCKSSPTYLFVHLDRHDVSLMDQFWGPDVFHPVSCTRLTGIFPSHHLATLVHHLKTHTHAHTLLFDHCPSSSRFIMSVMLVCPFGSLRLSAFKHLNLHACNCPLLNTSICMHEIVHF